MPDISVCGGGGGGGGRGEQKLALVGGAMLGSRLAKHHCCA